MTASTTPKPESRPPEVKQSASLRREADPSMAYVPAVRSNDWLRPAAANQGFHGKELKLLEMAEMFAREEDACAWIEKLCWPQGPCCPHYGFTNVECNIQHQIQTHGCREFTNKPMFTFTRGLRRLVISGCCCPLSCNGGGPRVQDNGVLFPHALLNP